MPESTHDDLAGPVRAERVGPAYWRVTFDNPPIKAAA